MSAIQARHCYLCRADGHGDLVHFATRCTLPAMAQRRAAALGNGEWARVVNDIALATHVLAKRNTLPQYLRALIEGMPIDCAEAVFITSRIITSAPWTAKQTSLE